MSPKFLSAALDVVREAQCPKEIQSSDKSEHSIGSFAKRPRGQTPLGTKRPWGQSTIRTRPPMFASSGLNPDGRTGQSGDY
jgi:hypothetical protein